MPTGIYPHKKGRIVSEETRKKMSKIHKGKIISLGHRNLLSKLAKERGDRPPSFLGKKHTKETIEKIRKANTGKKRSKETCKKLSEWQRGSGNHNYGKRFSVEHRRKMGLSKKGSKHPWWRGGITPINRAVKNSFEYKEWRRKVFERDNYTCQKCYKRNGNGETVTLNAHHLKEFAYYPELRFEISNGQTLCVPCHKLTDSFKKKRKKNEKY